MPHFGEKKWSRFIPYNAKIADITHADVLKHFLDLAAALPETRKIIAIIIGVTRVAGTGYIRVYPNEGVRHDFMTHDAVSLTVVIADGTQRLQYNLTVANDDFDLYCLGYVVEV